MPQIIGRDQVLELLRRGVPVVDVLPPKEHQQMRIAGSLGIWLRELDSEAVARFHKTDPIVVYCHDHL